MRTVAEGAVPRASFKRKVAMYICYDGSAYSGLQKNEGVTTVAGILETALFKSGHITEWNYGDVKKIGWVSSARTDKGVSAASNVVAMKLSFPRPLSESGEADNDDLSVDFEALKTSVNAELPADVRVLGAARPTSSFSAKEACSGREYEYLLPVEALSGGASLQGFANILAQFEGTHSFHNYTIGDEHRLPPPRRAIRYITLCTCAPEPVVLGVGDAARKLVRIRVSGQSFQLHQIRKQVAAAVLVERGMIPADSITRSFEKVLINIPPAPPEGLFLNKLHFLGYNKRFEDKLDAPIETESFEEAREKFKAQFIYPSILRRFTEDEGLRIFFDTVESHPPVFQ